MPRRLCLFLIQAAGTSPLKERPPQLLIQTPLIQGARRIKCQSSHCEELTIEVPRTASQPAKTAEADGHAPPLLKYGVSFAIACGPLQLHCCKSRHAEPASCQIPKLMPQDRTAKKHPSARFSKPGGFEASATKGNPTIPSVQGCWRSSKAGNKDEMWAEAATTISASKTPFKSALTKQLCVQARSSYAVIQCPKALHLRSSHRLPESQKLSLYILNLLGPPTTPSSGPQPK